LSGSPKVSESDAKHIQGQAVQVNTVSHTNKPSYLQPYLWWFLERVNFHSVAMN